MVEAARRPGLGPSGFGRLPGGAGWARNPLQLPLPLPLPLELFLRVITVSLETMKVVEGLPGLGV